MLQKGLTILQSKIRGFLKALNTSSITRLQELVKIPTQKARDRDWQNFSISLKSLHRLHTTNYNNFEELFTDYLQTGCKIFQLETGIISKVIDNIYIIDSVNSNLEFLQPKLEFILEDTYCQEVVKRKKTIAYSNVGKMDNMKEHPVYQNLKLESYIGTPILIDSKVYGTLNFSSIKIKNKDFTIQEKEVIELMAQGISKYIVIAQKERSLQESEARFQTIANSTPIMIWMADSSGKYTFFNAAWLKFTGNSLEGKIGDLWNNGVHPEDRNSSLDLYLNAIKNRQFFEIEYRLESKDGEYRWILDRGMPRFSLEKEFLGYVGTCIDITDRRKSLASLEKQHRRSQLFNIVASKIRKCLKLKEILATAATEIKELLEVDRVLIIRLLNESATIVEETDCINCSSLKGKEIFNLLGINDYLPEYRDGKTKIINDFNREIANLNLQGKTLDLGIKSALIAPIFTKEQLWGLLAIHQCYQIKEWEEFDIELSQELADRIGIAISLAQLLENLEDRVEQRTFKLSQANQQLQEQIKERTLAEKKLRIITDNIPAFIAYIDDRERYLFNNKIYADWFDRPLSQITGQRIRDVVPEEYYKKIKPSIELALAGEKVTIDTEMIRDNGDSSWFNANFLPDLDRDRRVKGFFALIVDITERKAIEEMKNNFLSIVSHELRTPLTSIHGSLKLLATGKLGRLSPEGLQMLSIADVNTDRLVRLVEDILNLKQMESGKVRMAKCSCSSSELIHQAIDLIGPIATENKIILIGNSSNISFWADSDYILQVLTNLIDNGIKFSPPGGTIWITARLHPDGSQILFSVRDRGKGIPPNQLDIIFKSFHQVDASDSREKGGTGLGLAICQTIVQLHGGRIWVESVLGRGSTFSFTLPLCKP